MNNIQNNREPRYRCFSRITNTMSPPASLVTIITEFSQGFTKSDLPIALSAMTFLQSTGLKDKQGTEVFEGYILRQNFENEFGSFTETTGVVEWCENHAALEVVLREGGERQGFTIGKNCEVLGNIYEHPDLLKNEHTLQTTKNR